MPSRSKLDLAIDGFNLLRDRVIRPIQDHFNTSQELMCQTLGWTPSHRKYSPKAVSVPPEGYEPIYLRLCDLEVTRNKNISSGSGPQRSISAASLLPFSALQHWAIQVRGTVYEVTEDDSIQSKDKVIHNMRQISPAQWESRCRKLKLKQKIVKVGLTTWTDGAIQDRAKLIWLDRFKNVYKIDSQNCQTFAYLLFRSIQVKRDDLAVTNAELRTWYPFPNRVTQLRTLFQKLAPYLICGSVGEFFLEIVIVTNPLVENAIIGVIFVSLVSGAFLIHSRDKKWLKKMNEIERQMLFEQYKQNSVGSRATLDTGDSFEKLYYQYNKARNDEFADFEFDADSTALTLENSELQSLKDQYNVMSADKAHDVIGALITEAE